MYEGEFWSGGQPNGYGRYIDASSIYVGNWMDGIPHGTGSFVINKETKNTVRSDYCPNAKGKVVHGKWIYGENNCKSPMTINEEKDCCTFVGFDYPFFKTGQFSSLGSYFEMPPI